MKLEKPYQHLMAARSFLKRKRRWWSIPCEPHTPQDESTMGFMALKNKSMVTQRDLQAMPPWLANNATSVRITETIEIINLHFLLNSHSAVSYPQIVSFSWNFGDFRSNSQIEFGGSEAHGVDILIRWTKERLSQTRVTVSWRSMEFSAGDEWRIHTFKRSFANAKHGA